MSVSWYWYRLQLLHFAASCFQEINKMSVAIVFHGYQDQKDTFLSENYNTMIIWFLIIFGSLYLVTCSRVRINNVWVLSQLSHSVMVILNPLSHEGSRFEKSWVMCVLIPFTKNTVPNIIDTSSIPILSWHQHLWRTVWVPFLGLSNTKQTAATFVPPLLLIFSSCLKRQRRLNLGAVESTGSQQGYYPGQDTGLAHASNMSKVAVAIDVGKGIVEVILEETIRWYR